MGTRDDGVRVELVLAGSRLLRLEVRSGGWLLRGGVVGDEAIWRRGDEERTERAHGFLGSSPAFVVALAALGPGRRRLVMVADSALATRVVDQQWTQPHPGSWHVDDLATGERAAWTLDDDVVTGGPDVELATLTRP